MQPDIDIRRISGSEIKLVQDLAEAIWPATYKEILAAEQIKYMMNSMYSRQRLLEQVNEHGHQFLILSFKEEPKGFASYSETAETNIYKLHKIYIHMDMQGKGLGKIMIDYIINQIKRSGAIALELNVNRNNKARYFYEKLGFTIVREEDIDIGGGYFMNDYVLSKKLIS